MGPTDVEVVSELGTDGRPASVINTTEITTGDLAQDPQMREIASKLSRWVDNAKAATGQTSMFDRGMFTPPDNVYDEMRAARNAVKYDATVAGVAETTEAYAFQGVKWEGASADDADVFNQLARDQNLDAVVRAAWLEEFTCGQFVAAKIWGWREYCTDEATEILTKRGWLRHDQVEVGDETLGVTWEAGRFVSRWTTVEAVNRFSGRRQVVHMTGRGHDSVTTLDHRWLIRPYPHAERAQWTTSSELFGATGRPTIPLTAERVDGADVAKYDDDLVELVAWFYTEGHFVPGGKIGLTQSPTHGPVECARIALLERMLGPGNVNPGRGKRGAGRWTLSTGEGRANSYVVLDRELSALVRGVVDAEKVVDPAFLSTFTTDQARLFVDVSLLADGAESCGRRRFSQRHEGRARSFEMACALAGLATSARIGAHGDVHASVLVQRDVCTQTMRKQVVEHEGIVWCPTTGTGTWLARRNGAVFFTGNTVRGTTTSGNRRKKAVRVWAPLQVRILDSAKIVPVGVGPLGGEMLAWQATAGEIGSYQSAYAGEHIDPLMVAFFQGTYQPDHDEASQLAALGVNPSRLLVMNPNYVFRHTLTKPDYERFAQIRLKSIFALLDLKRQLMQSDRATLIGAANYILLIRKGAKDEPAMPAEMENLRSNYNFLAKMPVIISDHRLNIDIIAPKVDFTLDADKYQVLDSRILTRLFGTLTIGGSGQRNETQTTLSGAIARVMENRRHMLKRTLELHLARAVVEHPRNAGVFKSEPNLVYTPRNVALALDPSYVAGLLALRTQREISRETILEYFGLDEATEAQRLEMEAEVYDDIFKTAIPYAAQGVNTPPEQQKPGAETPNDTPESPAVSGGRGGRPLGGGASKKSPAATAKPKSEQGNPKTGTS